MSIKIESEVVINFSSFDEFISSTIKSLASEQQVSEWKRIFEDTMTESCNNQFTMSVLCERVKNSIDKYLTSAEKKILLQNELQNCFETMYSEHFKDRYKYNPSINSFYNCRNGSLDVVASDEIFFSIRDKFPETTPPLHINLIWKMLKSKLKIDLWLQFVPSAEWRQKCLDYALSFVETEEEAKMLLYIIGTSINQTSVDNTTFIWLGGDSNTREVNAFFQRLGYKFAYVIGFGNQLLSNIKYSFKPVYMSSSQHLVFLRFKETCMRRSFALIENNAATFLCCCSNFASEHVNYHETEKSLRLLDPYLPCLEENIFSEYIRSNVFDSTNTSTHHLVHVKELYDDFIDFLEAKKFPLNLIGQEQFKKHAFSKLKKYENIRNNLSFLTGKIQLPTLYSQFHEFCQQCIHLDDRIYVNGQTLRLTANNTAMDSSEAEEKKAIQKAYKSYKSWHMKRFQNESVAILGHDLLEEEEQITSRTKITAKVFDCFAIFKYAKNISHIHVRDDQLNILTSQHVLPTLVGNSDITEIISSELSVWSKGAPSSSVAT